MTENKNIAGRKFKFQDVKEVQKKIAEFWEYIKVEKKPATLERLAVFLDCNIDTIRRYERYIEDELYNNQERYNNITMRAIVEEVVKTRDRILADKVERLTDKNTFTPGLIFDLGNNYKDQYKNKQELDLGNKDNKPFIMKDVSNMTAEELDEYQKSLLD